MPRFLLLEGSYLHYPPPPTIALYFPIETDMGAGYHEKINFFELQPARNVVVEHLLTPKLVYSDKRGPSERLWEGEVDNPFTITDDSSAADIVVTIGVEQLEHGDTGTISAAIGTSFLWGILGTALSDNSPKGYILANVKAEERLTGKRLYDFQVAGISRSGLSKRDGLQGAIANLGESFSRVFLRARN